MVKYCRVCARSYAILESIVKNEELPNQLLKVLRISVSKSDKLPIVVCNPCKELISCMWDFHNHVQKTQLDSTKEDSDHNSITKCRICGCSYKKFTKLIDDSSIQEKLLALFQITLDSKDLDWIICQPCKDAVCFNWRLYTDAQVNQIILEQIVAIENEEETEAVDCDYIMVIEKTETVECDDSMDVEQSEPLDEVDAKYTCILPLVEIKKETDGEDMVHSNKFIELMLNPLLRCTFCEQVMENETDLSLHYKKNHETKVVFPCKICRQRFSDYRKFSEHCLLHDELEGNMESPTIDTSNFRERREVSNGILAISSKVCDEGEQIPDSDKFIELLINPILECEICQTSCKDVKELTIHYRIQHKLTVVFPCKVCCQRFLNYATFYKHYYNHNTKKGHFYCICCRQLWYSQEMRLQHENSKYENYLKDRQCGKCFKTFLTNDGLRLHNDLYEKHHLFPCNICNRSFIEWQDKIDHLQAHQTNLAYSCRICKQNFVTIGTLSLHEMTHRHLTAKVHRFHCVACGSGFQTKSEIEEHLSSHKFHTKIMKMNSLSDLLQMSIIEHTRDT